MPRLREFRYGRWSTWAVERVFRDNPTAIAVDTETEGLNFHSRAFCATLTWRGLSKVEGQPGPLTSAYLDFEEEGWEARRSDLRIILGMVPTWVFHNAKFDLQKLDYIGALPHKGRRESRSWTIEDTQPLAALLDENRRLALKSLAVTELGIEDVVEVEVKSGPNKGTFKQVPREKHVLDRARRKLKLTVDDGYHLLPREVLIPYAIRDTELTLLLWEKLRPLLPADLEPVYLEEIQTQHVLRRLESNGVGVDLDYLDKTEGEYGVKVMETWQVLVDKVGKEDFNPASPQQVTAAFKATGVTLESTDKAALRDLAAAPGTPKPALELVTALQEYREASKIHSTYLRPLQNEHRDGVVNPWFNAVGPRTGRTSSSAATN